MTFYAFYNSINSFCNDCHVRITFHQLVRSYHPDKNPNEWAKGAFLRLKEAYDRLKKSEE